jgi:hyperosmotically inducible protein
MKALTLMGTLAAAVALTACGRPDDGTAARSTDAPVVAQAEPRDESLGERTAQAARDAGDAMERGAAITASVNSELARDDELSALGIDVDTDNGRVTMSGTAPNEAARERATQLASAVRGVVSVDNQLRIENQGDAQPAQ